MATKSLTDYYNSTIVSTESNKAVQDWKKTEGTVDEVQRAVMEAPQASDIRLDLGSKYPTL